MVTSSLKFVSFVLKSVYLSIRRKVESGISVYRLKLLYPISTKKWNCQNKSQSSKDSNSINDNGKGLTI